MVDLQRCGATHILVPFHNAGAFARWANVRRLMRAMKRHRIAIVHARVPETAWLAKKAAQICGIWFVVTCHGNHDTSTAAARRRNAVMAYAERVIAVSETVAEHLRTSYPMPSGRLSVVPLIAESYSKYADELSGVIRTLELLKVAPDGRITRLKAIALHSA